MNVHLCGRIFQARKRDDRLVLPSAPFSPRPLCALQVLSHCAMKLHCFVSACCNIVRRGHSGLYFSFVKCPLHAGGGFSRSQYVPYYL